MKTLASFWKNSVASFTAAQNAAAIANGTIIPQRIDSSGNDALLTAPAQIVTMDSSGNMIALAPNSTGALVPTTIQPSSPVQALTSVATSLGLIQPAATPTISSDTIVICIAGGIALIGILALIFKH